MTTPARRQLLLWRHAHTPWSVPDIDRAMDDLGVFQARRQAIRLVSIIDPAISDWTVLCSPATRSTQTLDLLLEICPALKRRVQSEKSLYNAGAGNLQALLERHSGNLLLVGHNPGLSRLAGLLNEEHRHLSLSPGSFVHLSLPASPDPGSGKLLLFSPAPDQIERE